ncbi:peptide chain release factor N(5)-glutamine methyltransferase [Candidatus Methylocalor cossyra]|uniref:Release factor glutamine methyltransferase n=1 Tax=Candidatus Methylocalor cossyra TaxID=3108543 RepID=A0ABM9NK34_9GAMM
MERPLPTRRPSGAARESLGQALGWATAELAATSETPRLEAEVLLTQVLGGDRAQLRAWPERPLDPDRAARFRALVERRRAGEPLAYITGEREFWSRRFRVGPGVLIPRPETELLVELALTLLPQDRPAELLDLGTGTGVIAVTLALERPAIRALATDLSPEALALAMENAARHGATNLRFALGNWFVAVPAGARFDLVVSNPPYIATGDPHLGRGDLRFEPALALVAGPEGLDALAAIVAAAGAYLKPEGWLLLEHGYTQADAVAALLAAHGYGEIAHHADLQGHRRVVAARRPRSPGSLPVAAPPG